MTGDYTAVPLRRGDRWTGARMQQGRVLLDHEWNLNVDAAARDRQDAMRDVIGPAGVQEDSDAFLVSVLSGPTDLEVRPGRMWVDGLQAFAPQAFRYSAQDQIDPLPAGGRVLAYLDVFPEHVQPAELPDVLVDPALAPVETSARTRVGYRVRVAATNAASCKTAFDALPKPTGSTGRLTIDRATPAATSDPCDPPGDPLGLLPEGMFRVEVLDSGNRNTARFAWSVDNGGSAVAATFAGNIVTLAPSASVKFATDDRVEVSWLARRADRKPHGPLYRVTNVSASAAGDVLTLDRNVTAPAGATGLVVRRWDGDVVGAASAVTALVGTVDMGLRFSASDGQYLAGDWWGARLRSGSTTGVERRLAVPPDGIGHAFAPLALVDLGTGAVLSDCRPTFPSLTNLDRGAGTCTVTVFPGDDLQAAVDALPASGGELCIAAGEYVVRQPVRIAQRRRVVVTGVGPATVVRAVDTETVFLVERSTDVEFRHLRAEGGTGRTPESDGIGGALMFVECEGVTVTECQVSCADATVRDQACVVVRGGATPSNRVAITGNLFDVGTWQTGVLVVDSGATYVARNDVRFAPTAAARDLMVGRQDVVVRELARAISASLRSRVTNPLRSTGDSTDRTIGDRAIGDRASSARIAPLTDDYAKHEASLPTPPRSRLDEIRKFLRATFQPDRFARLDAAKRNAVLSFVGGLAAAGQGIVVAGTIVGGVRIHDNAVSGTIQGIHVGASNPRQPGRERASEVVVSRNVVHAKVPASYSRERHAVFVGNARSVHIVDTVATLTRSGVSYGTAPDVDGIRVHGELGPFLLVRQSSLNGFPTGVRVQAVGASAPAGHRMWLVAETMAAAAGTAVTAPGVSQANNMS